MFRTRSYPDGLPKKKNYFCRVYFELNNQLSFSRMKRQNLTNFDITKRNHFQNFEIIDMLLNCGMEKLNSKNKFIRFSQK